MKIFTLVGFFVLGIIGAINCEGKAMFKTLSKTNYKLSNIYKII